MLSAQLVGVLAPPGCGARRGVEHRGGEHRAARSSQGSGLGPPQVDPEVTGGELLVGDELRGGVDQAHGQAGGLPLLEHLVAALIGEKGRDERGDAVEDLHPQVHVGQRRLGQLLGMAEHLEERLPVPIGMGGHVELPVAALPAARGRCPDADDPPPRAQPLGVVGLELEVVVHLDLLGRDVDELAPHGGPGPERGEHRHGTVRRGEVPVDVGGLRARRLVDRPDATHLATLGERRQMGGRPAGVRSGGAVGRDGAHDGARGRPVEGAGHGVETGNRPVGGGGDHHDVGSGPEPTEHGEVLGVVQVEHDAALAGLVVAEAEAVPGTVGAGPVRTQVPVRVTFGGLDEHHVGAQGGEQAGAVAPDRRTQVEHPHPTQQRSAHGVISPSARRLVSGS